MAHLTDSEQGFIVGRDGDWNWTWVRIIRLRDPSGPFDECEDPPAICGSNTLSDPGGENHIALTGGGPDGDEIPIWAEWFNGFFYQDQQLKWNGGTNGPANTKYVQYESEPGEIGTTQFPWRVVTTGTPHSGSSHFKTTSMNGGGWGPTFLFPVEFKKCPYISAASDDLNPPWILSRISEGHTIDFSFWAKVGPGSGDARLSGIIFWLNEEGHFQLGGAQGWADTPILTTTYTKYIYTGFTAPAGTSYFLWQIGPDALANNVPSGTQRDVYVDDLEIIVNCDCTELRLTGSNILRDPGFEEMDSIPLGPDDENFPGEITAGAPPWPLCWASGQNTPLSITDQTGWAVFTNNGDGFYSGYRWFRSTANPRSGTSHARWNFDLDAVEPADIIPIGLRNCTDNGAWTCLVQPGDLITFSGYLAFANLTDDWRLSIGFEIWNQSQTVQTYEQYTDYDITATAYTNYSHSFVVPANSYYGVALFQISLTGLANVNNVIDVDDFVLSIT